jgi:hypothetical protein
VWRPNFPFCEILSAGGSHKPQARPFPKKVIVRQFAPANNLTLVDYDVTLDTTNTENDLQLNKVMEEWTSYRLGKVQDFSSSGRAANTYVLHQKKLALKISR